MYYWWQVHYMGKQYLLWTVYLAAYISQLFLWDDGELLHSKRKTSETSI